MGYWRFTIVDQGTVPDQIPPLPAAEGTYVDYKFDLGSSGLFGHELNGWGRVETFLCSYFALFATNRLLGFSKRVPLLRRFVKKCRGSWYDLHASLP